MSERIMTLLVRVDENKTDWHWIYDSMITTGKFTNGLDVCIISNGDTFAEHEELEKKMEKCICEQD